MDLRPFVRRIVQDRTVRLVATGRLREAILKLLVEDEDLGAIAEIDGATSARLRAQDTGSNRLSNRELVHGVPHAAFINAAFSYWRPREMNRFNGPGRGAWYAAFAVETCVAEVSFHLTRELSNISDYNAVVEYSELFASFIGDFVDVRSVKPRQDFLGSDPAQSYPPGNAFAEQVRAAGHYGIVYPSIRHKAGTCLVALIPHAVQSVTQGGVVRLVWAGTPVPSVEFVAS